MPPMIQIINTVHSCLVVITVPHPRSDLDCKTIMNKPRPSVSIQHRQKQPPLLTTPPSGQPVSLTTLQRVSPLQKEASKLLFKSKLFNAHNTENREIRGKNVAEVMVRIHVLVGCQLKASSSCSISSPNFRHCQTLLSACAIWHSCYQVRNIIAKLVHPILCLKDPLQKMQHL